MKFDSASELPASAELETDVCVIGSGAAGLTIARELAHTSQRVLVVEAGSQGHDETAERDAFHVESVGEPLRSPLPDRVRRFGGSTKAWFGRIAEPDCIEFQHRPWVSEHGWPISLPELQPWLARAAEVLEVPHAHRLAPSTWVGHPTAHLLQQHRDAEMRVFLWAEGKDMAVKAAPVLAAATNVRVLLGAQVSELVPGPSSTRIESAVVANAAGRKHSIRAKFFVLASGGIENPRILLASSSAWPAGVGNHNDQVGRYYMDHPRDESSARIDLRELSDAQMCQLTLMGERAAADVGPAQLRLVFGREMQSRCQLLNHSLHGHFGFPGDDSPGLQRLREIRSRLKAGRLAPRGVLNEAGPLLRDAKAIARVSFAKLRRDRRPDRFVVVDQMEQRPDPLSRVTLSANSRDRLGVPHARLDWRIGEETFESQRAMHGLFQTVLDEAGLPGFSSDLLNDRDYRPPLLDMKHPMGTTRMARSAKDGVVDTDAKVHGVDNLYVAGSSVFPIAGHANPTLLIVALALRLAAHLKSEAGT
jgi:choline dehydrogenase-like flavoprotein